MFKKQLLITLPYLLTALSLFLSGIIAVPVTSADNTVCDINKDLFGEIGSDNYHAYVWNNSDNPDCVHNATFAMYEAPQSESSPLFVDTQKLIRHTTQAVKPGEKLELILDVQTDACRIQIDLVRGEVLKDKPYYYNALSAKIIQLKDCGYIESVAASAVSAPSKGSVEAANASMRQAVLAGTGNTAIIYSIIIAGAISLISGLVLKKIGK